MGAVLILTGPELLEGWGNAGRNQHYRRRRRKEYQRCYKSFGGGFVCEPTCRQDFLRTRSESRIRMEKTNHLGTRVSACIG